MRKFIFLLMISSPVFSQSPFIEDFNYPLRNSEGGSGGWFLSGINPNITQTTNEIPAGYYLGQNSPNPFNPVTNIYFSIPKQQHVIITVLDVLGKVVCNIVNEKIEAGTYKALFDASGLSSGVYFYELRTEVFTELKKMTVVK